MADRVWVRPECGSWMSGTGWVQLEEGIGWAVARNWECIGWELISEADSKRADALEVRGLGRPWEPLGVGCRLD